MEKIDKVMRHFNEEMIPLIRKIYLPEDAEDVIDAFNNQLENNWVFYYNEFYKLEGRLLFPVMRAQTLVINVGLEYEFKEVVEDIKELYDYTKKTSMTIRLPEMEGILSGYECYVYPPKDKSRLSEFVANFHNIEISKPDFEED